jgi:hypothetical protein
MQKTSWTTRCKRHMIYYLVPRSARSSLAKQVNSAGAGHLKQGIEVEDSSSLRNTMASASNEDYHLNCETLA